MTISTEIQENRFIYHYCTRRYINGRVDIIDGIAQLTFRITSMDGYHKLKALIASKNDSPEDISITSLSFIGMEMDR